MRPPTVGTVTLHPALDQTVTLSYLAPGAAQEAHSMRFDAGGQGVNVAACLADQGVPVAATGLLGEDHAGAFTALFAAKGIDDRFVRVPGVTRTRLKLVDAARGETTDLSLPAPAPPAGALGEVERRALDLAGSCAWFVLAGSVPAGVPADVYAGLTARLRERGRKVAVDTGGAALAAVIAAAPDLMKLDRAELERLLGVRLPTLGEVARAAQDLRARGPGLVAVSLGAEGALFAGESGVWLARPPLVTVATTVGAGDAMVAGLVAGLLEGLPLAECARRGAAFAAAKLARVGPHLGPPEAVRALETQVEVRPFHAGRGEA